MKVYLILLHVICKNIIVTLQKADFLNTLTEKFLFKGQLDRFICFISFAQPLKLVNLNVLK